MRFLERAADLAIEAIALSQERRLLRTLAGAALDAALVPVLVIVFGPALVAWELGARAQRRS